MNSEAKIQAADGAAGACLLRETRGAVALLTLNRPKARNSLSEELLLALGAALAGYPLGLAVAWSIGRGVFPESAAAIGIDFKVLIPVTAVTLAVAAGATLASASRLWRVRPAVILRGE